MKCSRLSALVCLFLLVPLTTECPAQQDHSAGIQALLQQAGNAEDDAARLQCLKTLRQRPDLNEKLKADLDKLIQEIDRWVNGKKLPYFGRVRKTLDYDFGIAKDSPVYPLTYLYRARMLIWYTMESGSVWCHADRRRQFLGKARGFLEKAEAAYPENRITRMYLGEPILPTKTYPAVDGAPQWAVDQREGLERLADIVEWWIDHRQQEDAQYGGGWGDDCEMWRWWVPVLIAFDDPKITKAQARFSEAMMSQEHMKRGFTSKMSDVEHTAEDSADVITPMMHLNPDDPVWQKRATRLGELMETLWTGRNERGLLQYKSTYFTVDRVDPSPKRACDTVYHPRAVQPTLLYWLRTGDAKLGKLFAEWMKTWVDAAARRERGKPPGIIPSAIHWPDGRIGGLGENWWDPQNHGEATLYRWPSAMRMMLDTLLLTYHMTGDETYLAPIRSMAQHRRRVLATTPQQEPRDGSAAWCASRMGFLNATLAKYRLLTGGKEFDDLLSKSGSYMAFRMGRGMDSLTRALKDNAEALRINWPGYTSEVRYTDRVLRFPALFRKGVMVKESLPNIKKPKTGLLYSAATGDPGGLGYFPLNAVRWLTPPREIAVLVTDTGKDRLVAKLFHFGEKSRPMSAELYLLSPGDYGFELIPDTRTRRVERAEPTPFQITGPRTRISFDLPPRERCTLEVRRMRP